MCICPLSVKVNQIKAAAAAAGDDDNDDDDDKPYLIIDSRLSQLILEHVPNTVTRGSGRLLVKGICVQRSSQFLMT